MIRITENVEVIYDIFVNVNSTIFNSDYLMEILKQNHTTELLERGVVTLSLSHLMFNNEYIELSIDEIEKELEECDKEKIYITIFVNISYN